MQTGGQIVVWDRSLKPEELRAVSNYLLAYLAEGGRVFSASVRKAQKLLGVCSHSF